MPSSRYEQIPNIIELVIWLNPCSILDIGAGFGKYGFLCREYLELWDGRQKYTEFRRRIDAVEAFQSYITPMHQFLYNNIYTDDILNIVDNLNPHYELVLLIDVLEHFEKGKGLELVKSLLSRNSGLIICTPKNVSSQQDAFGNDYERHKSSWTQAELRSFGNTFFVTNRSAHLCYIGPEEKVSFLRRKSQVKMIRRLPLGKLIIHSMISVRGAVKPSHVRMG